MNSKLITMKQLYLSLLSIVLLTLATFAQTPQAINYQGLARDNSGSPLPNQQIGIRLSILSGSATGTPVYVETHTRITDAYGLFTLQIGQGNAVTGAFNNVAWGSTSFFLKVEIDTTGGTNYELAGTTQFAAVPYALNAKNGTPNGQNPGDMLYWNGTQWLPVPVGTEGQVLRLNSGIPTWGSTVQFASIITTAISGIGILTTCSGGNVSDGGAPITARGICWRTTPGPTIADSKTSDGTGSGSYTSHLMGLTMANTYYVRAYATNSKGTSYGNELSFTIPAWQCGTSAITVNHLASGGVAPVDKSVSYGTVTNMPGETDKCWITQNLGSDHQATSVSDATEASAGWYWQFNKKQGYKHDGTTRTPATTWISSIYENSDWVAANDPCALELGSGWRLPTNTEWTNLDAEGGWVSWTGPFSSGLKLHAAGYLDVNDGSFFFRGTAGTYQSSTQDNVNYASYLYFDGGFSYTRSAGKAYGLTARCLSGTNNPMTTAPVTTIPVTGITTATASSGGNIVNDGGSSIIARGVCWSTSANPTVTDPKTTDGTGQGTFISSITGLAPSTNYHLRAYSTNSSGTAYGSDVSFTTVTAPFICGSPLTINHSAGAVAPVDKTTIYGTVTNIPGETDKCWITQNLGSDHHANSIDDASEASAGWYWQFNKKQGYKHDGATRTPATTWIGSINENSDWVAANDPCTLELGSGWRIPTNTEWDNLILSGNLNTWSGSYASGLKLHDAGYLIFGDGSLTYRGSYGNYWSSTQDNAAFGWFLYFSSDISFMFNYNKAFGMSVRCCKD